MTLKRLFYAIKYLFRDTPMKSCMLCRRLMYKKNLFPIKYSEGEIREVCAYCFCYKPLEFLQVIINTHFYYNNSENVNLWRTEAMEYCVSKREERNGEK